MIELTTTSALMVYLALTLIPLMGLWGFSHFTKRKKKIVIQECDLLVCEFCHFGYLSKKGELISQCPQCFSFNKKI
jgi:hypothetical protein